MTQPTAAPGPALALAELADQLRAHGQPARLVTNRVPVRLVTTGLEGRLTVIVRCLKRQLPRRGAELWFLAQDGEPPTWLCPAIDVDTAIREWNDWSEHNRPGRPTLRGRTQKGTRSCSTLCPIGCREHAEDLDVEPRFGSASRSLPHRRCGEAPHGRGASKMKHAQVANGGYVCPAISPPGRVGEFMLGAVSAYTRPYLTNGSIAADGGAERWLYAGVARKP